jgi:hypothetical protein
MSVLGSTGCPVFGSLSRILTITCPRYHGNPQFAIHERHITFSSLRLWSFRHEFGGCLSPGVLCDGLRSSRVFWFTKKKLAEQVFASLNPDLLSAGVSRMYQFLCVAVHKLCSIIVMHRELLHFRWTVAFPTC